jgi:hypothetical protein
MDNVAGLNGKTLRLPFPRGQRIFLFCVRPNFVGNRHSAKSSEIQWVDFKDSME